jgi:hypothetical protein
MTSTPGGGERDSDAREAFVQWASLQAAAPRGVVSLIERVEPADDHVGLLSTEVEGRRVVWKLVPIDGRTRAETTSLRGIRGGGKTICDTCGGQRKMYGYASNGARRLLNCVACRGKGDVDCPHCRRGLATCATCAGEGHVQRWIEIERWRRSIAGAHPDAFDRKLATRLESFGLAAYR